MASQVRSTATLLLVKQPFKTNPLPQKEKKTKQPLESALLALCEEIYLWLPSQRVSNAESIVIQWRD